MYSDVMVSLNLQFYSSLINIILSDLAPEMVLIKKSICYGKCMTRENLG